ncbi:MAG TPA: type I-E CRISPR-associated protein Cas5/CasD [Ktedonobacterales bacterium]|nr:type I-E CRISPR-associated protein Cas5/CasD [Ktedonobacterales bacterium]
MTTTLLLRLAGPMQSWGTRSRFRDRDTGQEPSKSGVVGLLAATLGRTREASVDDLAALRMGVRVDRPGSVQTDFQTAGAVHRVGDRYGVARAENPGTDTAISWRAYLADASFLVGLEGTTPEQEDLLVELNEALAAPVWPLFLGRKGYVPGWPIRLPDEPPHGPGLSSQSLEVALSTHAWVDEPSRRGAVPVDGRLRLVLEVRPGETGSQARNDQPLSFASADRRFTTRYVVTRFIPRPHEATAGDGGR